MYEYGVKHILHQEYKMTANVEQIRVRKTLYKGIFAMCMVYLCPSTIAQSLAPSLIRNII